MKRLSTFLFAAFFCLFSLASCKHTPDFTPEGEYCEFKRHYLSRELPTPQGWTSFSSAIADAGSEPSMGPLLFLSGGSQNGAFGAGFLQGLKEAKGEEGESRLPDYQIVTGVSTGALISTAAYLRQPEKAVSGYRIEREAQLLDVWAKPRRGSRAKLNAKMIRTALRRGAISDLTHLDKRLSTLITDDDLVAVANKDGGLFVAATDLDAGEAVAFDMRDMASKFRDAETKQLRDRYRACYFKALRASSIVPPGALPVSIDNRLYIDGGVRYAVFAEDVGAVVEDALAIKAAKFSNLTAGRVDELQSEIVDIHIILNGTGEGLSECKKRDSDDCAKDGNVYPLGGARQDWDIVNLAERSLSLLINQVERLSIERAAIAKRDLPVRVSFAKIRPEDLSGSDESLKFKIDIDTGRLNCAEWQLEDDKIDNPLEFHSRYMHCLTKYGISRGQQADWDKVIDDAEGPSVDPAPE